MATEGNTCEYAADEMSTTGQDRNRLCEIGTKPGAETANSKHKNPFGSLLTLAWKLWEAELKKTKLASGRSSGTGFTVADIFRTHQNLPVTFVTSQYAPYQVYTNATTSNTGPVSLSTKVYRDVENSVIGSVRHCAEDYAVHTSYSPDVTRNSNIVAASAVQNDVLTSTQPHWRDSTGFENDDSAPDEELHLSERRRHQCHMCSYQTDNRSHMLRHQATAHDACKLYHCYICKMDFSRSERAKSHFLSIHPEIPYHSKIIRKRPHDMPGREAPTLDTRLIAKEHKVMKIYGPAGTSAGPTLGRKSWEKYCCLIPPSGSSGCYFRCVRCTHVGPDIWHLKRHFLDTHSGTHAYSCRVCRYSTGDIQRLIGHMTGHGELFCHQCSFSTVELERFKEHLSTCTGEGPTDSGPSQCPVCGDHFEDTHVVKEHVFKMHQRDYCMHCACVIYGPETIDEHLLQHQTEQNTMPSADTSSDGHMQQSVNSDIDGSQNTYKDVGHTYSTVPSHVSKEALEVSEEGMQQSKYRFGRFSNQTYYCPVEGCPFKATWKKSIELHTLNYHTDAAPSVDDHAEPVAVAQSSSPDLASATAPVAISGLFNCPFCPNCRTFKYRKSYEKHLLQHGVDYMKHPYLVIRSSQRDDFTVQNSSMFVP